MSGDHTYVYKAGQIIMTETGQQWIYCVIFEDERYEPFPPRIFDNEEEALKAATDFCDNRIDNVTTIDGFHRRKA
jgi:hypothetical protein